MAKVNSIQFNQEPRRPWGLIALPVVIIFLLAWALVSTFSKPLGGSGMTTLARPWVSMSVGADGRVNIPMPVDGVNGMPNCDELKIPDCKWSSKLRRTPSSTKDQVIETTLTHDGKVVGRAQVMEIETAEYEELRVLSEMGHDKAWISHIEVTSSLRGNGLGHALWRASDAMIKSLVGPGQAIMIFVDQAGWGQAIMSRVSQSDILVSAGDWWAYIIR